jgi:hypothetical protein
MLKSGKIKPVAKHGTVGLEMWGLILNIQQLHGQPA